MLVVDVGHSVTRKAWRGLCKCAPRLVAVNEQQSALLHVRFHAHSFVVIGQGCSPDAEYGLAKVIIETIKSIQGAPPLAIYAEYPYVSIN